MMDKISFINTLFDPTEATIEFAAQALHNKMEAFDPRPESIWTALSDQERNIYRLSVKTVLRAVAEVYVVALTEITS